MESNCIIYVGGDEKNSILGVVVGDSASVRGAVQQYQKSIGPLTSREAFNDFVQRYKGTVKLVSAVTIDVTKI